MEFYYGNNYSYGISEAEALGLAAGVLAVIMLVMLFLFVIPSLVLQIIGLCKVFKKAGRPVGFVFIPVYNAYVQFDIAGCRYFFWAYLPMMLISFIGGFITPATSEGALILALLLLAVAAGSMVLHILWCIRLARAFGKGGGFAVGLIFLPFIFLMILGCGNSTYLGGSAPTNRTAENAAPDTWKCESCGAYNLQSSRCCFNCGGQKEQPALTEAAGQPEEESHENQAE